MLRAGAMALQGGGEAGAARAVAEAVRDHPDHPQLWQLLGLIHRTLDDHPPAVNAFAGAAALAPADPMIAHGRACVCFEAGLPAAALFAEARRLNQPDRAMLLRHAAARIAEGDGEAAMAEIEAE